MFRKSKLKYQISWKIRNCLYLNIHKIYLFVLFKKIQMSDHRQLSIRALAQQLSARSSDVTAPLCLLLSTPHTQKHTLSSACSPSGTCWPSSFSLPVPCALLPRDLMLTLYPPGMIFPSFLASLTLFTSAHLFKTYTPKCFLMCDTKQRHCHADVRSLASHSEAYTVSYIIFLC